MFISEKKARTLKRDALVILATILILTPILTVIFIACADNDDDSDYCTISFDANKGRGSMKSFQTLAGKAFIIPRVLFTRAGWKFDKWEAIRSGEEEPFDTFDDRAVLRTEQSLTLRAVWEEDPDDE